MTRKVLAIDDAPDVHQILDVRLKPDGVALHHALGAEEGLAMARELRPDLILLDVDLPGMDGFTVCQKLKEDSATGHIPVIFLTGDADLQTKVKGFDLGAIDYVTKPFEPAELRARVRAALRTKRYHDMLAARALIDGLTGVYNRTYFDMRIAEECAASRRYARAVSLVFLDVDHFKGLNDSHGHPFGDLVLQTLGDLLTASLRACDAACRYGGEEFAIILTETNLEGGYATAERLRTAIAEATFQSKSARVPVTASFGVSCTTIFPATLLTASGLVTAADDALYKAKRGGRNRVCAATPPP